MIAFVQIGHCSKSNLDSLSRAVVLLWFFSFSSKCTTRYLAIVNHSVAAQALTHCVTGFSQFPCLTEEAGPGRGPCERERGAGRGGRGLSLSLTHTHTQLIFQPSTLPQLLLTYVIYFLLQIGA